ncbi:glycosyltransferase [Sphingopyxis panaciterrae]|uniref:glycosyltransferase n=1 Tax=Sphingopyxis panaciterrae TaxID=363841 RepID=UPI001ABAC634
MEAARQRAVVPARFQGIPRSHGHSGDDGFAGEKCMIRLLYLTWGEVPRMSSVYGGQVVDVVAALQHHPRVEHAALVAGYPLIHSGMVREKWRYRHQLAAIRARIGAENFRTRRIPVPPVGVYPKPHELPLFFFGHHAFLAEEIRRHRANVIQCRSYVAALFALRVREHYGLDIKVVFDARSLMPDEACISGRWSRESDAYRFWKEQEKQILATADVSNAVSKPMQDHYDRLGARKTALIHLNAKVDHLNEARIADVSRLDAGAPLLAYAGYLHEGTWHDPRNLWAAFAGFRRHCPNARLLVITKSAHAQLRAGLAAEGLDGLADAISFTSAESPAETIQLLQNADISVLSYRTPANEFERELAEPVFATKTAEYLAVGLPLLVNHFCGGARDYAISRDAGVAYDPATGPTADQVATLLRQSRERVRISRTARSDFSVTDNAGRLVSLFESLPDSAPARRLET